ncbi:MAG: EcoRV family type II restriction endonuclease [Selenomonadaceae bacterium]|nr:EcoRV family type II restriction endonuclease [Selenomonadaceae bacterium]
MQTKILTKQDFLKELKTFFEKLPEKVLTNDEWTMRGVIDIFKKIYPLPPDTKVVSKILELHLFPYFLSFADNINFNLELAEHQNWYPDLTFVSKENSKIKFAVDLKTTYRDERNPDFCNGFTLGSHGEYFTDRKSKKNVQYPYGEYIAHFCIGIIYTRKAQINKNEIQSFSIEQLAKIPAVARDFIFFAEEKWKIAADNQGSGNTANIGSIKCIGDIIAGKGVFSLAGEKIFDEYWVNFGKLTVPDKKGGYKKLSTLEEFLSFKGLPLNLSFPKRSKQRSGSNG